MSILFTFATNLSDTVFLATSFFTTSLILLKSTGADINLSISNLSTSAFKLNKSDFAANFDISTLVDFLSLLEMVHRV